MNAKSNLYLKVLMSTFLIQKIVAPFFFPGDWEFCREVEGVLNIQQSLTTLSQNESRFNGAFAGPIKQRTRNKLVAPTIDLINLDRWVKYSNLAQVAKAVVDLTENGNTCRKRALLECERRFLGMRLKILLMKMT